MSALALAARLRDEDGAIVYRSAPGAERPGADALFDEIARIERERRAAGDTGPLRILFDLRAWDGAAGDARGVVYRRHKEFLGRRVAVLGASRLHEFVVQFLLAATGHRTTRYFTDESAARAYLTGGA